MQTACLEIKKTSTDIVPKTAINKTAEQGLDPQRFSKWLNLLELDFYTPTKVYHEILVIKKERTQWRATRRQNSLNQIKPS